MTCQSVYPPSATGPYSDDCGWSGPLRCVLSEGHPNDLHLNSGIGWHEPIKGRGTSVRYGKHGVIHAPGPPDVRPNIIIEVTRCGIRMYGKSAWTDDAVTCGNCLRHLSPPASPIQS